MKTNSTITVLRIALTLGLATLAVGIAPAQINEPTRELFQKIIPQLDSQLQAKFRAAMQEERSWIEFSADEFLRFRQHPANPFSGLSAIDPRKQPGSIRLEFKVPSPRDRIPISRERQHRNSLQCFDSAVNEASRSTVKILADDRWVALGTVVSSQGLILTKASELKKDAVLVAQLMIDGELREFSSRLVRTDPRNDLALLKIDCPALTPVQFYRTPVRRGQFVVTPDETGSPLFMGVVSTEPRCLVVTNQAYLGVKPIDVDEGVQISEVTPGGSAELAGLRVGDIITRLDQYDVQNVSDLVNSIRLHPPGSQVRITVIRERVAREIVATLNGRNVRSTAEETESMTDSGAIISARHSDFPLVFQHDSPLLPETCGGPLVDLDGHVIGVNIAREGRVSSLAIGSAQVQTVLDQLLRENVAAGLDSVPNRTP